MKNKILTLLFLASSLLSFTQVHVFKTVGFVGGGSISSCSFSPTTHTFDGYTVSSFPGFGTTHSTAAFGDHVHTLTCNWLANGTRLYYNAGNVGIGLSNPSKLLEVAGMTKTTALMVGPYNVSVTADCSIPQSLSGLITNVTATLPLTSSGGTTPNISMSAASIDLDGYLTKEDWFSFNERVMSVYAEPPLQCSGGLNPSIQMQRSSATVNGYLHKDDYNIFSTRASKNSSGYLHMDDFDNFNNKVSSQWNNNTGYIDYGAGNVAIKGKDPTHTLEVTGTFKVYDYKSTSDFVTQFRANAGSAFMSGVYTNATTPGVNGSYLYNHSVYAAANGGSYFSYFDQTQNYNYQVGIFDGTGLRKTFCGLVGGAGGVVDLGTAASPWGNVFTSNITNSGNLITSGLVGIGTTAPTALFDGNSSTTGANLNLNSTYALQAGTGTQTIAQVNLSHLNNTYYARSVLRYNKDNSHYEYQISLKDPTATRVMQWVDMTTGKYELRSGIADCEFNNSGWTAFTGSGGIGIGTTSPVEKFAVNGKSAFWDDMKLTKTKKFYYDGGTNDYVYQPSTDVIDFYSAGGQRMRIKGANGCVKIGRDTLDDGTYPLSVSNDFGSGISSIGVTAWAGTSGSTTFLQRTSGGAAVGTFAYNLADKALAGIGSRVSDATGWVSTNANKGNLVLKCNGNHSATNFGTYWQFNVAALNSTAAATEVFRIDGEGSRITGSTKYVKVAATPALAAGETATYTKGNYYVIAYNDAGTMKYRYFDQILTANPPVWVYSTTAP